MKSLIVLAACLALAGCFGRGGNTRILPAYTPPDPPPLPGHKPSAPLQRAPDLAQDWPSRAPASAPRAAVVTVETLAPPPKAAPKPVAQVLPQPVPKTIVEATPKPATQPATAQRPARGQLVYQVQKGDTLSAIAQRYALPVAELGAHNGLAKPYKLRIGQKLQVPDQRRHRVAKGETTYGLAVRYDTDLISLVQLNGLAPPYSLTPGQVLLIPGKERAQGGHLVAQAESEEATPATPASLRAQEVPTRKPGSPRVIADPPALAGGKLIWPVNGRVILGFGPKKNGQQNDGINIAAPRGTPVRAVENGVVAYSGNELRGFGNLVLIKHQKGLTTAYAHVDELLVGRGETVRRGQLIGRVGSTGSVDRPQLHFKVRQGARAVNPAKLLGRQTAQN